MKKPIFLINKLIYSKNKSKILNINKFDFHRGAMYLFSGPIGSGKSTLMRILSKNYKIDNGLVFYEDNDINKVKNSDYKREVLFLDKNNKRPWLGGTVKNYMIKKIKSKVSQNHDKAFKKICNSMKISDYLLKADISLISEGEFRWVLLSIAIAIDTKVLIINYLEKFLDSNRRIILNRILKRKSSHDGVTIIASSYNPDFFKMSTSIFIKIDNGRVTQVRTTSYRSK
jgi:ABC-type cobalamin/Fe3+-siderophores transport system ATPase subunit